MLSQGVGFQTLKNLTWLADFWPDTNFKELSGIEKPNTNTQNQAKVPPLYTCIYNIHINMINMLAFNFHVSMYHAFKTPVPQNSTRFFQPLEREITLGGGVGDYIFA